MGLKATRMGGSVCESDQSPISGPGSRKHPSSRLQGLLSAGTWVTLEALRVTPLWALCCLLGRSTCDVFRDKTNLFKA